MPTLRPGHLLRCVHSGEPCRVVRLLDEGGQGGVYESEVGGRLVALKWYHDPVLRVDRGLPARLQVAIDRGAPSGHFLWPFERVTQTDGQRLGYLMPLRTPGLHKIQAVMAQRVRPSFRVLARVGGQLTEALLALHAKGLAYQDLNAGNVFFDAETGRIEICDNDNVDIDGAPSVMGGVWEYQAPEVVMRRAGPSRATDLHSLAVMLFKLLHIGHPLVGRRELGLPNLSDPPVLRRLYGSEARFVFDPADDSNRPVPELHGPVLGHWALYPRELRELFTRAFTEGLHDPLNGRVQETEWRRALRRLHDAVTPCGGCGAHSFYDPRRLADKVVHYPCWQCGRPVPAAPPRLGLRRVAQGPGEPPAHVVVLAPGAQLFGHHLGLGDGAQPVARVDASPGPPQGALRLHRQQPGAPWPVFGADGAALAPGESVALVPGLRIALGHWQAEVRA